MKFLNQLRDFKRKYSNCLNYDMIKKNFEVLIKNTCVAPIITLRESRYIYNKRKCINKNKGLLNYTFCYILVFSSTYEPCIQNMIVIYLNSKCTLCLVPVLSGDDGFKNM